MLGTALFLDRALYETADPAQRAEADAELAARKRERALTFIQNIAGALDAHFGLDIADAVSRASAAARKEGLGHREQGDLAYRLQGLAHRAQNDLEYRAQGGLRHQTRNRTGRATKRRGPVEPADATAILWLSENDRVARRSLVNELSGRSAAAGIVQIENTSTLYAGRSPHVDSTRHVGVNSGRVKDGAQTAAHVQPAEGVVRAPDAPQSGPSSVAVAPQTHEGQAWTKPSAKWKDSAAEGRIFACLERKDRAGAETELFNAYGERVLGCCLRMLRNRSSAEDVSQQVFLQACRDLGHFKRRSSLATWLYQIAKNRCLDAIKAQRSTDRYIDRDCEVSDKATDVSAAAPDALLDHKRRLLWVQECLQELPPDAARTVRLRFQDDLSYEEMGVIMNANPATLNQRVLRALPLLADCLQRKGWAGE
jgi:RNA polymerase sigma-70 factor, ECF subfamily